MSKVLRFPPPGTLSDNSYWDNASPLLSGIVESRREAMEINHVLGMTTDRFRRQSLCVCGESPL